MAALEIKQRQPLQHLFAARQIEFICACGNRREMLRMTHAGGVFHFRCQPLRSKLADQVMPVETLRARMELQQVQSH